MSFEYEKLQNCGADIVEGWGDIKMENKYFCILYPDCMISIDLLLDIEAQKDRI